MEQKPYLTFYKEHGVSPVRQDLSNTSHHFERRRSLYRLLGIPESLLKDKKIIEFGPGSGHNSVYTASLSPSRYWLVDGNPTGLADVRRNLSPYENSTEIKVIESEIESFTTDERFDLVICEGVIPGQADPASFTRYISQFVAPGGILLISCQDAVPFLSDTLRRFAGEYHVGWNLSFEEKLAKLLPFFEPHLRALPNMSRRYEDWIIDNVIQHWPGKLFSIPEAIQTLSPQFLLHGSSPRFINDWRWYKDIYGEACDSSGEILRQYAANLHNFLDNRRLFSAIDESTLKNIDTHCTTLFQLYLCLTEKNAKDSLATLLRELGGLEKTIRTFSKEIADALEDARASFEHFSRYGEFTTFGAFEKSWGRGQQYVSLIRSND